jgi:hypothetical protein
MLPNTLRPGRAAVNARPPGVRARSPPPGAAGAPVPCPAGGEHEEEEDHRPRVRPDQKLARKPNWI